MKFLLISPKNRTIYNFRGDLIKSIQKHGYDVIVTGPDRENIEYVNALGVRFYEVRNNKNGTSVFKDIHYYKELKKIIKLEKPDVVLSYTVKPVIYGTLAASRIGTREINCLITGAGYTFTSRSFKARIINSIVTFLYRKSLKKATNVIFQNKDDLKEFVDKRLVSLEKTHIVNGSGVNLNNFYETGFPSNITFLMISRLLYSKGVMEYLNAAKMVKEKYPNVRFILLGKYEDRMNDRIPKEVIEEFVSSGVIERFDETNDVMYYYASCSVYVLPSYREGVPRTVLEALACHRPVITTNAIGCKETVINEYNGFLVDVKDYVGIFNAMTKFIEHPNLIQIYGDNSYELCKRKFDVDVVNSEMLKVMHIE